MIESQLNYVLDALDALGDGPGVVAEVLTSVAQAFTDELAHKMSKTVWGSGCASWYQNQHGRNIAMWPDYTIAYRRQTRHFDPADYVISGAGREGSA